MFSKALTTGVFIAGFAQAASAQTEVSMWYHGAGN
jgi:hypothetical protein